MEKEQPCRKTSSTEYAPTKCRITRPPPPKPATNPLQFIKVGPSPLYKKAEPVKKKEEPIKIIKPEVREEPEDWQHNLDSWKSNRRKRQEHIIERVEEVKKIGQECPDRGRKRTTFNEILEKRNSGRSKFNIALYQDDSNELDDLGLSSGHSSYEKRDETKNKNDNSEDTASEGVQSTSSDESTSVEKLSPKKEMNNGTNSPNNSIEQYTYEGAIQNYRKRIGYSLSDSIFLKPSEPKPKDNSEVESLLPKGTLFKRKELFEAEKKEHKDNNAHEPAIIPQRLIEDFANSQSIKERLQSLEKCTSTAVKLDKPVLPVRGFIEKPEKVNDENGDNNKDDFVSKSETNFINKHHTESCESEDDLCINRQSNYQSDFNNFKKGSNNNLDEFTNNYPPSVSSSNDMMVLSSDKEDSGIHTADVSCSVSQSDDAFEDIDISNTIPKCIEKLNIERNKELPKSPTAQFIENEIMHSLFSPEPITVIDTPITTDDLFSGPFVTKLQPPSVKPPPPPVAVDEQVTEIDNTPHTAKEDLNIKRSTFLGLPKPPPEVPVANLLPELPSLPPVNDNTPFNQNANDSAKETTSMYNDKNNSSIDSDTLIEEIEKVSEVLQPIVTNSVEDEIQKREKEIIELMEKEEKSKTHITTTVSPQVNGSPTTTYNNPVNASNYSNFDEQDSEVLKVEQELMQLEQEELKRQRESMLFRERSREYLQNYHSYENLCDVLLSPNKNYCKSMPELNYQMEFNKKMAVPVTPVADDRNMYYKSMSNIENSYNSGVPAEKAKPPVNHRKSMPDLQSTIPANYQVPIGGTAPVRMQYKGSRTNPIEADDRKPRPPVRQNMSATEILKPRYLEQWAKPKNNHEMKNYNQHWLIQEAEFRRLSEKRNPPSSTQYRRPAPIDNFPEKKASSQYPPQNPPIPMSPKRQVYSVPYSSSSAMNDHQNVMLSVSGKKKCSYCGNELGRGAAMIIETLGLFYHMECFKCCVCHVELGDGLMGTDVRVRNQKLHCQNCYSSDDGVKFSCV